MRLRQNPSDEELGRPHVAFNDPRKSSRGIFARRVLDRVIIEHYRVEQNETNGGIMWHGAGSWCKQSCRNSGLWKSSLTWNFIFKILFLKIHLGCKPPSIADKEQFIQRCHLLRYRLQYIEYNLYVSVFL